MKQIIALIGQKNVGKSTLFNQLTRGQKSLVSDVPGLTRDRKYGELKFNRKKIIIIDTGNINTLKNEIEKKIAHQTKKAIKEANIIFFLVDCNNRFSKLDSIIAKHLHKSKKKIYLLINKIDKNLNNNVKNDFIKLGIKKIHLISSLNKKNVKKLIKTVISQNSKKITKKKEKDTKNLNNLYKKKISLNNNKKWKKIKIAVIGRQNVGNSTLINQITKENRMIVCEEPGTTRDNIDIKITKNNFTYTFFDTAGILNKKKIEKFEKKIMEKSIYSIKISDIILFVMDINEKINKNDLLILNFILKIGKSVIILINKLDTIPKKNLKNIQNKIKFQLKFINYVKIQFISALKNTNIEKLFKLIHKNYISIEKIIKSSSITKIIKLAEKKHKPPLYCGKKIKIKYVQTIKKNPIIFIIHGKNVKKLPNSYKSYLKNFVYKTLNIIGIQIQINFKNSKKYFS